MMSSPRRDGDERRDVMRLTKDVREQLLEQNEGFSTTTSYEGKNASEHRRYTIAGGKVEVHASGRTSWADSRYSNDSVADDEETHRYLYRNLDRLDTSRVVESRAVRTPRPSRSKPAADDLVEDETFDDESSSTGESNTSESGKLVVGVVLGVAAVAGLVYVVGRPAWNDRAKPAIERRRAIRAERKVAASHERELAAARDGVTEDETASQTGSLPEDPSEEAGHP